MDRLDGLALAEGVSVTVTKSRTAGLIYLVVVVTGLFTLGYVPSRLIVDGDAARTVRQLLEGESLWRWGIVAGYACYVAFLLLPLELYRVLHPVNRRAAVTMVALAMMIPPIAFLNQRHLLDILSLLGNAAAYTPAALEGAVTAELSAYRNGQLMAQLFWGLWLWPFGMLVYQSRLVPRGFGVILMVGCVGYVAHFLGTMLLPGYPAMGVADWIRRPAGLGEMGIALWLAVVGVKEDRTQGFLA